MNPSAIARALAICGASIALLGCALQATAGGSTASGRGRWPVYGALEGRIHNVRDNGSVFGWRLAMSHEGRAQPLRLRSFGIVAGYRFRRILGLERLGSELGLDMQFGQPSFGGFEGVGFYGGGHAIVLYRMAGDTDLEDVFALLMTSADLVLELRGGPWSVPETSVPDETRWELAAELGLRFTVSSDLVSREAQEETR